MKGLLKPFVTGFVIGGFAPVAIEFNKIVLKTLWRFNCTAAEIAWDMFRGHREQLQQQQRLAAAQTENEDENDDEIEDESLKPYL